MRVRGMFVPSRIIPRPMTVPEARRHRDLARFDLRRRRLQLPGITVSLVVPASVGDLVRARPVHDPDLQPYWAEVWPASLGLARLLLRGPSLAGARVLDLGCGLGLAGTAAGLRGGEVTFADREPEALAFANFNAAHNGVAGAATMLLDWNHDAPLPHYDLVLLADVTYSERNHAPLLRLLGRCLAEAGRAVAVDPFRAGGDTFAARAAAVFACSETAADCFFAGRRLPLRVVTIAPRAATALRPPSLRGVLPSPPAPRGVGDP
jgi:predicted nicotinamide N-methyase